MSYSISSLLTRNLHTVCGENDSARRRTAIDEIFHLRRVFYEPRASIVTRTRSIPSPERSWRVTLTFETSQLTNRGIQKQTTLTAVAPL